MTVRFAAKINLITSKEAFQELVKKEPGPLAGPPWNAKTRAHTDKNAWTEGAFDCNAGGMANPLKAMLFHFQSRFYWWDHQGNLLPQAEIQKWESRGVSSDLCPHEYSTALEQDYKDLKHPNLRGLVTAGADCLASSNLRNFLKAQFTRFKIPFSVLSGAPAGKDLHYSRPKDTWTLFAPVFWKPLPDWHGQPPVEKVKSIFKEIAIDPGDTLCWEGTPIPAKTLAEEGLLKTGDQTP